MDEKEFERIENYLGGLMAPADKQQFEHDLAEDENLAALFGACRLLQDKMPVYIAHQAKEDALKASIAQLNNNFIIDNTPVGVSRAARPTPTALWKWMLAAVCVGGIVIACILLINPAPVKRPAAKVILRQDSAANMQMPLVRQPSSNHTLTDSKNDSLLQQSKALYAANFTPDDAPDDIEGPLQDAFESYAAGDYKQAAVAFGDVDYTTATRGRPQDTALLQFYAQYYQALCNLALRRFSPAETGFKQAIKLSPNSQLNAKASWYLALAYLALGKTTGALQLLNQLAGTNVPGYSAGAAKLVNRLQPK